LDGMPPGELGDASRGFRCAKAIPDAARPLVDELLKQIRAGLSLQVAGCRPAHDLATRLLVGMLSAEGVDEGQIERGACLGSSSPAASASARFDQRLSSRRARTILWTSSGPSARRSMRLKRQSEARGVSSVMPREPWIWIARSS